MLEVPRACESRDCLFRGELQDWTSAGTASCRGCKRLMSSTCNGAENAPFGTGTVDMPGPVMWMS